MAKPITGSTNPRLVTVKNILRIQDGRSIDTVLATGQDNLSDKDRALAAELTYGICRWYYRLEQIVNGRLAKALKAKDRDIQVALMLGVYQLLYSRMPEHAAVSTAVDAVKKLKKQWAVKLVNGVLRGIQREAEEIQKSADEMPESRYAHASWFVEAMQTAWPEQWQEILSALQQRPPMTLRVNLSRTDRAAYAKSLMEQSLTARPHPIVPSALTLDKPHPVAALPGFAQGDFFVQDAAAQLAAILLDVQPGQRVLDACAAPGGKTTHILEQAEPLEVVALDVDEQRLHRVHENLERMQQKAEVCAGDASKPDGQPWAAEAFDRILLDAPCSATGVMRRHPDIKLLRRKDDIVALVKIQAAMLKEAWQLLRPGGKLLYATCSLMPQENFDQVAGFLADTPDASELKLSSNWGHACNVGRQVLPGEHGMDGFYYALMEKQK